MDCSATPTLAAYYTTNEAREDHNSFLNFASHLWDASPCHANPLLATP